MKRITLMVAAVLMVSILAGCATTSGTTVKKSTANKNDGNLISVTSIDGQIFTVDKTVPWPGYAARTFTLKDLEILTETPEFWNLPENVTTEKPIKHPVIGRIINNSDKEYTFWIVYKITNTNERIYKPDYLLEIKVPAHSTKYYIYDKPEMPTERGGGVYTKKRGSFTLGGFTPNNFDGGWKNWELATKIWNEMMSNHYEEIIFDNEEDLDEYKNYINIVEPFEYNKDELNSNWVMRK